MNTSGADKLGGLTSVFEEIHGEQYMSQMDYLQKIGFLPEEVSDDYMFATFSNKELGKIIVLKGVCVLNFDGECVHDKYMPILDINDNLLGLGTEKQGEFAIYNLDENFEKNGNLQKVRNGQTENGNFTSYEDIIGAISLYQQQVQNCLVA